MTVFLVGAGPGDPGLITVRGAELLGRADVVVYDRLSISSLLDLAPAGAERISVGKTPRGPSTPQEEINALLVERGLAGQTVVRLKGGDPFVFARGGEEALALHAAGVPFEIVPGVSSAIAVPAYAGVPVTHRGLATSFTVVTGHEDPWAATETDWDAVARLAARDGTVVVLMGAATRADIASRLLAAGLPGTTPVVAVQSGSRHDQRTVRTTLDGLGAADVGSPLVIVVGAVASIDLPWFEQRPLFGCRVVVTRARPQAGELATRLRSLGADVIEVPAIAIEAGDPVPEDVSSYDWVVCTSRNAVDALFAGRRDARSLGGVLLACVGPGTDAALAARGVVADLVPSTSSGAGLVAAFPSGPGRVLLPQSDVAEQTVREGLVAKGWFVDAVVAYRTVAAALDDADRERCRTADVVAFTSSSTVRHLVAAVGVDGLPARVVCIGPSTADAARAAGATVTAVADPHTLDGLVDAVAVAASAAGNQTPR